MWAAQFTAMGERLAGHAEPADDEFDRKVKELQEVLAREPRPEEEPEG